MATSHHIGLHRMPPILQSYAADFPEVELDLHFMASEEACQAILHGTLELAVVTLPLLTPKNLEVTPLWIDPLCFVCGHQHPLAKQTHWDTRDLVIHTAILPGAETTTRQILENTLAGQGIKINTGMSTNYLETIRMMVSIGLGWSLLPQSMLDNTLCELRINSISLKRTLGIIKHRERTLSNAASKIIEKLKEYHSNHDV
jgi:DNA-binding transcriptional LysR family regulator